MGISDLRDAFNSVAEPRYTAERAFYGYERAHDVQWQRLSFVGHDNAGQPFTVKSELIRFDADCIEAAKDVARGLLAKS